MVKAVLTTKVTPAYDDLPERRYHFPSTYLRQIEAARGDWIVYYEPRRATSDLSSSGGRQCYFATARIDSVAKDPVREGHFYAHMSGYLGFPRPVPFAEGRHYYEGSLQKADGSTNRGAFGRAVRNLSDHEFALILAAGFATALGEGDAGAPSAAYERPSGLAEPATIFTHEPDEVDRRVVEQLVRRPFRDRAFSTAVKAAYRDTCAVTGLRLINGGGRSEVQAAHIRPVERNGPDSVRNGIALSGTVHWMFDRGLISFDDDGSLLVAKDHVPDEIGRALFRERAPRYPERLDLRPHPRFLEFHRENIFKG